MDNLKIVFRVDASVKIGTGHVMRCYTLAEALVQQGATVHFICADTMGHLAEWLAKKQMPVSLIASKSNSLEDARLTQQALEAASLQPDWIIVDHYGLDSSWEKQMRPTRIMVIDDLANRPHDCDLLLDQNYYLNAEQRYGKFIPESCRQLLGPQYALMRPDFVRERKALAQNENHGVRQGRIKTVLVFLSGSDSSNETMKCLRAIAGIKRQRWDIQVVIGSINPFREQVETFCKQYPNMTLHCQVDSMASLMAKADLAIGAGGVTTWERLALGLPSIVLMIAENQVELTKAVESQGLVLNLGKADEVSVEDIQNALIQCAKNPGLLREMSEKAFAFMDADGVGRILEVLSQFP